MPQTLLVPLLDQDTDTANQTVLSQRERCQEAFLSTRDSLLESLDPQSSKSVIEASSLLGRKWLSVIPISPALRLTNVVGTIVLITVTPGVNSRRGLLFGFYLMRCFQAQSPLILPFLFGPVFP
jgi:hypothetical protein